MVAVTAAVLEDASDLTPIRCYCLHTTHKLGLVRKRIPKVQGRCHSLQHTFPFDLLQYKLRVDAAVQG